MSQQTQRRRDETTFIEPSGGILTEQLLHKLREEECSEAAVAPQTFALNGEAPSSTTELDDETANAWEDLKERWDSISQDNTIYEMDTSEVRDRWLIPLLEHLDFEPVYQSKNLHVNGLEANLSHYGWMPEGQLGGEDSLGLPPVTHLIQPDKDESLDSGNHIGTRASGKSPHDEIQRFLNAADQQWSLVADGLKLRLLRDYYHTYTRGYIEFDLENIFTNRNYEDFRALYRLCHASRFVVGDDIDEDDADAESPLESLYQIALATGVKIGEDLQSNVVEALEKLGNGFLTPEIRSALEEGGQDEADQYYQDLLRVVYRLLFLMFAEQRGMMADRGDLYTDEYSINTLRDRSERAKSRDTETDLWEGLQVTFRLVGGGYEDEERGVLSVPGYNGGLFDDSKLEYVTESTCPNHALLDAIHKLTHVEQEGYQQRISYADLGVDEIGAVYESLLEFTPQYADTAVELEDKKVSSGTFYLDDRGMERKETGSYYTKPELVDELIDSALKPVVDDRVGDANTAGGKEEALLSIDVCDPACGSGAFLIAANNYLGKRLAEIRSETEYPDEKTIREARRSVVQHCLYGVDLNPMAVELAKVSLWINSAVKDQPLSFLDHRIKQGNSLIGTNEELIRQGVPVGAYPTTSDCGYDTGNEIRKRIRSENNDINDNAGLQAGLDWRYEENLEFLDVAEQLEALEESEISDVEQKAKLFEKLEEDESLRTQKLVHDVWTAAFYWPMDGSAPEYPSPQTIERIRREAPHDLDNPKDEIEEMCVLARTISEENSFFHWQIEYPLVFYRQQGFDCVLGNPPWEQIELKEEEFFATRDNKIAKANTNERSNLIKKLNQENPDLYQEWKDAVLEIDNTSKFVRKSGRYPYSGAGDVNTYPLFTELSGLEILNRVGRMGIVVKTGIATDYYTQDLFANLIETKRLVSLFDFVNKRNIFPDVALRERFCLLTMTGVENTVDEFEFSFFNWTLDELNENNSKYTLTQEDIERINPNTKNCPIFKSAEDRDMTLNLYSNVPILVDEKTGVNPWGISYKQGFYNMSSDSDVFSENTLEKLNNDGLELGRDGIFRNNDNKYLPLWEGKFFQQFDHRFGSFEGIPKEKRFGRRAGTKKVAVDEKQNKNYEIIPRYWVEDTDFEKEKRKTDWDEDWLFAFRETGGSASNSRTSLGTIIPMHPCSHKAPILTFSTSSPKEHGILFTTLFTSFAFDFALQQSLGGSSVSYYIVKQLPMPTPDQISNQSIVTPHGKKPLREFLIKRGLKLIWTSHSLDALGEVSDRDSPYEWDEDEREQLRAEVDAAVALSYGLSREDFKYILDSFSILEELELEEYGIYKTKEKCIESFDKLEIVESN